MNSRATFRSRIGVQRKADENALAKKPVTRPSMAQSAINAFKATRPALNEVTVAANRKPKAKDEKDGETSLKRSRSASLAQATGPQRVPVGPGRPTHTRVPSRSSRPAVRTSRVLSKEIVVPEPEEEEVLESEVAEFPPQSDLLSTEHDILDDEDDVEPPRKVARVWPDFSTERTNRFRREVDAIKEVFHDEVDIFDTTMVSEYSEEIFEYMNELEEDMMPNADYMVGQSEINWAMRQTLVDWLLQVHLRYHMLPETLWIAINIVDRFLTKRVVSLVKLQLVGVTAMFIAAKYEEILAPSVDEFVFMTENGYTREEILKGERIVLQTLEFRVSHYCSPYSWMRKISKADDYDIQTRTLSKFLTEATLLDNRFLCVKPSLVAAIGMYTSRRMLGGDWGDAFVYHSGYTEEQLRPGHALLVTKLVEPGFGSLYVCKKYGNKKFLKASVFAIEWALRNVEEECDFQA